MKNLFVILVLAGVAYGCPSGITPCKCTDTLPGVTIDCTSAHSSKDIQDVFAKDWPNPRFQFFQVVPLTAKSSIEALPDNVFGGKTFLHCWIGDTDIALIGDDAFAGMEDTLLEILMGKTEKLSTFPVSSLTKFNMLYKIEVMKSSLKSVGKFGAVAQLAEINFPNSQITSIESGAFDALPRLTHVDLSYGKLEKIEDGWFSSSTTVNWSLYLTNNKITEISGSAFSGTYPSSLYLSFNELTSLPEESFKSVLEKMSESSNAFKPHIDVTGNPLECDCKIKWLATNDQLRNLVTGAKCSNGDANGMDIGELPEDFFDNC